MTALRRFFVAMGGQAVHEERVGFGVRHQRLVDLVGAQLVVPAFLGGLAVMHRDPGVGDHQIGPFTAPWPGRARS
jgi:uncharacterized membrane protein